MPLVLVWISASVRRDQGGPPMRLFPSRPALLVPGVVAVLTVHRLGPFVGVINL